MFYAPICGCCVSYIIPFPLALRYPLKESDNMRLFKAFRLLRLCSLLSLLVLPLPGLISAACSAWLPFKHPIVFYVVATTLVHPCLHPTPPPPSRARSWLSGDCTQTGDEVRCITAKMSTRHSKVCAYGCRVRLPC
jgi:hypothetical protein